MKIGRFAGGGVREASRRCVIETTRVDESRGVDPTTFSSRSACNIRYATRGASGCVGPTTFSSRSAGSNDEADPCGARFVVAETTQWLSNPSWETRRLLDWIAARGNGNN